MLNAIIQNKNGETVVIDLTSQYHEIYRELQTVGCYKPPDQLLLQDEEDMEYSVKLYSESDVGNHMLLLLNERNSLCDAYLLDLAVTNARKEIKADLEQKLLHGQYTHFSDVLVDINRMKAGAAGTRLTFFCPLEASMDEGGDYYPVTKYEILDNRDRIEEALRDEQTPDLGDMAEYLGDHSGLGGNLLYAVWGVGERNGELYGKIDCYLHKALDEEETEKLRQAITGQNSDGFGEGFEQRPIKTGDGDLYVSFWNFRDDYFLYTESEMDEYLQNRQGLQLGGM